MKQFIKDILVANKITNYEVALFVLESYHDLEVIEKDLIICNEYLLGCILPPTKSRKLNYPSQESSVIIDEDLNEQDPGLITIWINHFPNPDCLIPVLLFKTILEWIYCSIKTTNGIVYSNKKYIYNGNYLDGKREGKWIKYYESGKINWKGQYKNGERVGIWKEFYKSGKLSFLVEYGEKEFVKKIKDWDTLGNLRDQYYKLNSKEGEEFEVIDNYKIVDKILLSKSSNKKVDVIYDSKGEIKSKKINGYRIVYNFHNYFK